MDALPILLIIAAFAAALAPTCYATFRIDPRWQFLFIATFLSGFIPGVLLIQLASHVAYSNARAAIEMAAQ